MDQAWAQSVSKNLFLIFCGILAKVCVTLHDTLHRPGSIPEVTRHLGIT